MSLTPAQGQGFSAQAFTARLALFAPFNYNHGGKRDARNLRGTYGEFMLECS